MKHTAVDWLFNQFQTNGIYPKYSVDNEENNSKQDLIHTLIEQAKAMEKEQMLDFGDFIIDELEPMAQNRDWVKERYNYFKSE